MKFCLTSLLYFTVAIAVSFNLKPAFSAESKNNDTYTQTEIFTQAEGFFGTTTKGLAQGLEKIFSDLGKPNGYIKGEEFSGAFIIGLRYGRGKFKQKKIAEKDIFWQGPSVGFDYGGNLSKVFTLVYHLKNPGDLYRRFPGVEGSLYWIAGISINYQQSGEVILAPIRTGLGLRAGANIGYLHYNQEHSWIPF